MVRKPISEMQAEEEDEPGQSQEAERFKALSQDEFDDLNSLFDLLNSNSYETVGEYSMRYVPEDDRKIVSFDVVLPSSNDWDPAMVYTDE